MDNRQELSVRLASEEKKGCPMNEIMRHANDIFEINNPGDIIKPFAQVDIEFATFVDYLREHATRREKDLVYISENLQRAWKTLHISVQTLGEKMNESDEQTVVELFCCLRRIGLAHVISDGLRDDISGWIAKASDDAEAGRKHGSFSSKNGVKQKSASRRIPRR